MPGAYRSNTLAAVTAGVWLLIGTGLAAGPPAWRSSPSFTEVARVAPLRAVGGFCVVVGLLQLAALILDGDNGAEVLVLLLGAATAAAWVAGFAVAAILGHLASAAAPVLFAFFGAAQLYQADLRRHWR